MIFIIDVNIVISALIKDGKSRELLIDSPFMLYSPETLIPSIRKYENLILKKSGLSKDEFKILLNLILGNIVIIKREDYREYIEEAKSILGEIDLEDVPYIALALFMQGDIWSEDNHFQKQKRIKIWKTEQLVKLVDKFKNF